MTLYKIHIILQAPYNNEVKKMKYNSQIITNYLALIRKVKSTTTNQSDDELLLTLVRCEFRSIQNILHQMQKLEDWKGLDIEDFYPVVEDCLLVKRQYETIERLINMKISNINTLLDSRDDNGLHVLYIAFTAKQLVDTMKCKNLTCLEV